MTMKKIVAINSSKRKKNTYHLLVDIGNILEQHDMSLEIIHLNDYEIKYCSGCENCIQNKFCPQKDDTEVIMSKLKDADGIILSTPVYLMGIASPLKTFIDKTSRWFHRPELVAKPILNVMTTSASGVKDCQDYLNKLIIQWGAMPAGKISRTVMTLNNPVTSKELQKFMDLLSKDKHQYKPSLYQVILFQVQKVLASKIIETDRIYWQKKGWLNQSYFYDCKITPEKKLISNLVFKIISSKVSKQ